MRTNLFIKLYIFLLSFLLLSCDSTPLSKGSKTEDLKLLFYFVNSVGYSTASVFWTCSSSSNGYIVYGPNGTENTAFSLKQGKTHVVNLTGLPTGTTIKYTAFCKTDLKTVYTYFTSFKTLTEVPTEPTAATRNRSIWILGGVGNSNSLVQQVDLYDPDNDKWYANYTSLPTPRAYAQAAALGGKIYVMGGIASNLNTLTNAVEEYSPDTNTWKTMASMPLAIAGGVTGVV
ncbi:MAG TPA: kelch repeat-containing protein [Leptospiraceae bacterium]|nr:kelch repeat-containing protein [Leptospiraceae bacterium]HNF26875.1 kelch repeat-containing protein [Leptospiraceae bacterium]HNM01619.1 kelch repeat-containing protein [Leptospiraceae bacterium]HNN06311.1 kelch repeat-containing protein [Leptospiraceae bacterium]